MLSALDPGCCIAMADLFFSGHEAMPLVEGIRWFDNTCTVLVNETLYSPFASIVPQSSHGEHLAHHSFDMGIPRLEKSGHRAPDPWTIPRGMWLLAWLSDLHTVTC